jgi:hypothetical protein
MSLVVTLIGLSNIENKITGDWRTHDDGREALPSALEKGYNE